MKITALILTLCLGATAQAEIVFSPTGTYSSNKVADTVGGTANTITETSAQTIDFRLGLVFSTGAWVGGLYKMENASLGSSANYTGTAYGPSLGFLLNGLNLIGTYFLGANRSYNNSGTVTQYTPGTGYQIDLGYYFAVTKGFGLGPQLSYKNIKYTQTQIGAAPATPDTREVTSVDPYVAIFFIF